MAFAWFRKTEGFVPAEGLFQPGRFPAPGWFQPRAFSSLGLLPARGIVQQRVCSRQKLVKNILGMFRAWVFSSSSLVPAPGCFQRGVVSTSGLITPCFLQRRDRRSSVQCPGPSLHLLRCSFQYLRQELPVLCSTIALLTLTAVHTDSRNGRHPNAALPISSFFQGQIWIESPPARTR